jgi:hypothetical protein
MSVAVYYATFRDDIIVGAGAKGYDYDTGIKNAYGSANAATQHVIGAWDVIDRSVPSDAQQEFKMLAGKNQQTPAPLDQHNR